MASPEGNGVMLAISEQSFDRAAGDFGGAVSSAFLSTLVSNSVLSILGLLATKAAPEPGTSASSSSPSFISLFAGVSVSTSSPANTSPLPVAKCPQVAGSPSLTVGMLLVNTALDPSAMVGPRCAPLPCPATASPTRTVGLLLVKTSPDPAIKAPPAMSVPASLDTPDDILEFFRQGTYLGL